MPGEPPFNPLDGARKELLRERLGESVRYEGEVLERYAHDETESFSFLPEAVVLPGTAEEVAEVLRFAHDEQVPVTPRGAGTGLSGGALPVRGGIVLSLERLDRIRAIDPDDMVAEVEVGVVTGKLQEAAEAEGLLYPPDPGSRDSCQIGGNLAEDAAGPRSLRYGTTRQWVLGLDVALPEGRLIRCGGRNRKDAAGYNLTQLMVGSEGTLGVIVAAVLKLAPLPAARMSLLLPFPGLDRAAEAVATICRTTPALAACELLERRAMEAVSRLLEVPPDLIEPEALLLLELHGSGDDELLAAAESVAAVHDQLGSGEARAAQEAVDQRRLWTLRSRVGEAVKGLSVYKEVDTVVPRSHLADLVRAARGAAEEHGLEAICYGHAGDGNLHVNLLRGSLDEEAWQARRDAAESALFARVLEMGGSITGEHGVGWTQRQHLAAAVGDRQLEVMRRLKEVFDPRGILNPGKVFPPEGEGR